MKSEDILQIEKILQNYYRQLNDIKNKKQLLDVLEQNIFDLKKTLLHVYDLIPGKEAALRYRAVAGSYDVDDFKAQIYWEFNSTMERFKQYLIHLMQRQLKLKMQILYLEAEVEEITFVLGRLDSPDRLICEKSYGLPGKSNIQIGAELKMDEKTIRYRRKRIASQLLKVLKFCSHNSVVNE